MKNLLWNVEIEIPGVNRVQRRLKAETLRIGQGAGVNLRLGGMEFEGAGFVVNFDEKQQRFSVEFLNDKEKGKFHSAKAMVEWQGIKVSFSILDEERRIHSFDPEAWVSKFPEFEEGMVSLWHLHRGRLVESRVFETKNTQARLDSGFLFLWRPEEDARRFALQEQNGELHSLQFKEGRNGGLRAEMGPHVFLMTKVPGKKWISQLAEPLELATTKKDRPWFAAIGATLLLLGSLSQLFTSQEEAPLEVKEVLTAEMAKIVIENPKAGGNGQLGGGGSDTEFFDKKGGAGLAALDALVKENPKAGAKGEKASGILGALSSLDEGVKKGAFRQAGLAPSSTSSDLLGSVAGALGALNKGGKAGGGGTGIGGVGTKGLGGGGGGGTGAGYGTSVGNGLGKGEGFRNVTFEKENSVVKGGLDRSEVDAVVQENLSQIRFCYNRGLRNNPNLQGKVISSFTIGAEGRVTVSRLKDSNLGIPEVEDCIKSRISMWQFPKPRGGGEVTVAYPFLLKKD